MTFEIERKFLVSSKDFENQSFKKTHIKQGFLNSNKERVVRVRLKNNIGLLTIKGPSNIEGTTRFEWEKKINYSDAENLLDLCEEGIIEKIRYLVQVESHIYEVDVFLGNNKGLIVAEIELNSENEPFIKPNWLAEEVTGDEKYYNSNLSKLPFNKW
ncbi:CYTH domain-containing protein [Tenacibaculum sp. C7A-26P2]|uniref:CYTH domain-containing protein n=1 Tax=Tenacibaculum sp. C7A-26P2 TaxID=3447504 RepID=UPI003F82B69B